jgi:hypothetical protein
MILKDLHFQDMDQLFFSAKPSGNKLGDTKYVCFSLVYFDMACADVWFILIWRALMFGLF